MPLDTLASSTADALRNAGSYVADLMTPTLRLGVTGLSRAGKTVFITSLVRNLIVGGRLPFFRPHAAGRILKAYLEPQPDDAVPRFDYERHLATLGANPPNWPQSTRRISELRITIEYETESYLRSLLGPAKLHVDIVDYPGEWLTDLALMEQSFADWSAEAIGLARERATAPAAAAFLAFHDGLGQPQDDAETERDAEQIALEGARLFTAFLREARIGDGGISTLSPGRFLMPGDLEGSPLLTFFPLIELPPPAEEQPSDQPLSSGAAEPTRDNDMEVSEPQADVAAVVEADASEEPARPSRAMSSADRARLVALLARRFESYKTHVVRPFFREHFSRIDRQIVLVDVLGALNRGPRAVADLERALDGVLRAFRPGTNSWLSALLTHRVDHLMFAATKADHLHHVSHDRLEALLRLITDRAITRATHAGAEVGVIAMAALRATREAEARQKGETLDCIIGTPLPGETIDGRMFDGKTEAAVFPGDLPSDPAEILRALSENDTVPDDIAVVRFRPPRLALLARDGKPAAMPHIRLDRALEFLLGDKLK